MIYFPIMIVRRAEERDIPAITELGKNLTSLHIEFDPEYYLFDTVGFSSSFSAWLKTQVPISTSLLLVSEENGIIVGFMSGFIKFLFPWYKIKKVGHISFTFIDEKYRGKGIGTQLLQEAVLWFKSQDLPYVELYANEKNSPGLSFWKSHGFEDFQKFLRKNI